MMPPLGVYRRVPFTYIWSIENFSELTCIDVKSPSFVAKSIGETVWFLHIEENIDFYCHIRTNNFSEKECHGIDFEFSLLGHDGLPLASKRSNGSRLFLTLLTREDLLERRAELFSNNTLTVQCRIWRRHHTIRTVDFCHARTLLKTYKESVVWGVKEFSTIHSSDSDDFRSLAWEERKICPLRPISQIGPFMALICFLKRDSGREDVSVDFLIEKGRDFVFSCEISVLDADGNVIECRMARCRPYFSWTVLRFCPLIPKTKLIRNKDLFLPNDTLFLKCSFEVCTGVISSEIEYCTPNVLSVAEEKQEVVSSFLPTMKVGELLDFEEYFIRGMDHKGLDYKSIEEHSDSSSCISSCPLKAALKCLNMEQP